ncbi:hypothetical protein [Neomoorella glycerini]|uniref:hypothetical protein n=1 Tax=Neomoorella glycerini TaxID=55779 RepID=UPI0012E19B05|nr:hypothetical protein [Moorella glycerini]
MPEIAYTRGTLRFPQLSIITATPGIPIAAGPGSSTGRRRSNGQEIHAAREFPGMYTVPDLIFIKLNMLHQSTYHEAQQGIID